MPRPPRVWVPKIHPPSSGDHSVVVDEAAETINMRGPGEADIVDVRRRPWAPQGVVGFECGTGKIGDTALGHTG